MTPSAERDLEPMWLQMARLELSKDVREVPGKDANPRILEYGQRLGVPMAQGDETPWCAIGVGFCLEEAGIRSTRLASARSYLKWGVALAAPRMGAIAVLTRGADPKHGHVGFWIGESRLRLLLLGGNQQNTWSIAAYPKTRVVGYRWPSSVPI